MREHPVPQNVTSYEFHLIGNMTLKQFLELAAGIVIGVIIYQTNLPAVIKWPFIIFFAGLGALVAFVPFEGRPLDQWLVALLKAIYRPTEFYWRKSAKVPDYFTYIRTSKTKVEEELDLTPVKQRRIQEYITTLPQKKQLSSIDALEIDRLNQVSSLFEQVVVTEVVVTEQLEKPDMNPQIRSLQPIDKIFEHEEAKAEKQQAEYTPVQNIPEVAVPEVAPVTIEEQTNTQYVEPVETSADIYSSATAEHQAPVSTQQITTSQNLPFPAKPTQPNVVVGMIFDQYGKIVDNAIVEIVDQESMPVRAVKTNSIGQFFITTPLKNGVYFMNIEKNGLTFQTLQLTLEDTLLDPLEIRAQE